MTASITENTDLEVTGGVVHHTYAAVVAGTSANETLAGSADADTITGGDGNDNITGLGGNDTLNGNTGNDTVLGGDGADTVAGGQGDDSVNGNTGDDVLINGNLGNDIVAGGQGNDINVRGGQGNDNVNGNLGNDSVFGDLGDDTVHGGQGNDSISGGDGIDWMFGDLGNDTLTGGAGLDRFSFSGTHGADVITDFVAGTDKLYFGSDMFASAAAVLAAYSGGVITTTGGTITLSGTPALAESDIIVTVGTGGGSGGSGGGGGSSGGSGGGGGGGGGTTVSTLAATVSAGDTITLTGGPAHNYSVNLTTTDAAAVVQENGGSVTLTETFAYSQGDITTITAAAVTGGETLTVYIKVADAGTLDTFTGGAGTNILALADGGDYSAQDLLTFDEVTFLGSTGVTFASTGVTGKDVQFTTDETADIVTVTLAQAAAAAADFDDVTESGGGSFRLSFTGSGDYTSIEGLDNVNNIVLSTGANALVFVDSADVDGATIGVATDAGGDNFVVRLTDANDGVHVLSGISESSGGGTIDLRLMTATGDYTGLSTTDLQGFNRVLMDQSDTAETFDSADVTGKTLDFVTNAGGDIAVINATIAQAEAADYTAITETGGGSARLAISDAGTLTLANVDGVGANDGTFASLTLGAATTLVIDDTNIAITGSTAADTFTIAIADFTTADSIAGGTGSDTLKFSDNGVINFGAGALDSNKSAIDAIQLLSDAAVNTLTLTDALVEAADSDTMTVSLATTGAGTAVQTINASALLSGQMANITGGNGADVLTGGADVDTLIGGTGNDSLVGNAGADVLTAGAGLDTIKGNGGADVITLGAADANADTVSWTASTDGGAAGAVVGMDSITNFVTGTDKVAFGGALYTALDDGSNNTLAVATRATNGFDENTDEVAVISNAVTNGDLTTAGLANVIAAIGTLANTANGEDAIFILHGTTQSAIYSFVENGGDATTVAVGELTLLGVVDAIVAAGDVTLTTI